MGKNRKKQSADLQTNSNLEDLKKPESSSGVLEDIDALFAKKKVLKRKQKEETANEELEEEKRRLEKRQLSVPIGGDIQIRKETKLAGDRTDALRLKSGEWVDDGLGGIFNSEGFTGRRDETGVKVYKAHLFNKKGFGTTKDCPFDCDCCYI